MLLIEKSQWRYAFYRAYLNLRLEASKYRFGWLWWFLEPILMTAVFAVVFTFIRPRGGEFVYFLVVGVTAWLWFANTVGTSTNCLFVVKPLIATTRLPKVLFPLIVVITSAVKQLFVFGILLAVLGVTHGIDIAWLALPLVALAQLALILAVAMSVACLCVLIPDVRFLVVSGLQLTMFCSGIFFAISEMPEAAQEWFRLNPMAVLLEQYRTILLHHQWPDFAWCIGLLAVSSIAIAVVARLQRQYDHVLTLRIFA